MAIESSFRLSTNQNLIKQSAGSNMFYKGNALNRRH